MPAGPNYSKRTHPGKSVPRGDSSNRPQWSTVRYVELRCKSNFSFLRGASHPEELAEQAARLGYAALAITDRNTLAGVVRMHCAAKAHHLELIVGSEITTIDAPPVTLYATDRAAYGRLCRIITQGRLRSAKGSCAVMLADIAEWHEGLIAVVHVKGERDRGVEGSRERGTRGRRDGGTEESGRRADPYRDREGAADSNRAAGFSLRGDSGEGGTTISGTPRRLKPAAQVIYDYRDIFGDRLYLAVSVHGGSDDNRYLAQMDALAREVGIPLVATNDVHYHGPGRRFLQDVLTCIRERCTLEEAGTRLFVNAERHLKPVDEIARLFADCPGAVARTIEVADRCHFSLDELCYEYPEALCPPDRTPHEYLAELAWAGAGDRYPGGLPGKVRKLIEHELTLIGQLAYEPYFLTVWDIVQFARSRDILCQGRGSAANSAVCYCLGITNVDPDRSDLLFERFVSAERNEPPDIDVDFEHERREEVFQYIYNKYGRDHAGIVAEVITYRPRSAIRDVGKVLGLSLDHIDVLAKKHDWWDKDVLPESFVRETGIDPSDRTLRMLRKLVGQIIGFPRHLSQHVGGFVITRGPLCEMVPIENAAMPDRTFIEWDKDDIDALGILKIDCLALGMLTAIHKCFRLMSRDEGTEGRRDAGTKRGWIALGKCDDALITGGNDGKQKDISRLDRVAKEHRSCQSCLSSDGDDAGHGAVRVDHSDAEGGGFDRIQHCGGQRSSDAQGLHPFPSHSAWVARRTGNTNHDRAGAEDDSGNGQSCRSSRGNRSPSPGPDSKPAKQEKGIPSALPLTSRPGLSSPPPPRPSVPSSLRPFVPSSLREVPPEDPAVYDMICRADTVGVFQIESRAQMSMLPRLKPRCFYDLVIEVAIVRPGPIQGGMVHPYLRRRSGEEPVTYPNDAIKEVLSRTLGVPLFQEQAMRLAVVAAGFTPGEADQLRRAMGAWRRSGEIEGFRTKLITGMKANGLSEEFAERCFKQISGFGEYGFPESHAASFALLVYVSAWLKRYHPAAFCASILNSLPMGFYQPAQLVRDAREHGVAVRAVDVNDSGYDCRLEEGTEGRRDAGTQESGGDSASWGLRGPAVRLGMRLVKGVSAAQVGGIEHAGRDRPFTSVADLAHRSGAARATLARLAAADAMRSLGLSRREALWQVLALRDEPPMFEGHQLDEDRPNLPEPTLHDTVVADYETLGLSLNAHPISLIRDELTKLGVKTSKELRNARHGRHMRTGGLVLIRQRPSTALGIVFCTLEDETGVANLVIRPEVYDKYRAAAYAASALIVEGRVERRGEVVHLNVTRISDMSARLKDFRSRSRDFR